MVKISDRSDFWIINLFVLASSGVPLFARGYRKTEQETDTVLLAGFLSAIEVFTKNSLNGKITDLGLGDKRYFFHRSSLDYISVAAVKSANELHIDERQSNIVMNYLSSVNLALDILTKTAEDNQIDKGNLMSDFGSSADSFLFEATLEFAEDESSPEYEDTNITSGSSIDTKQFDRILKLIEDKSKDFFRNLSP